MRKLTHFIFQLLLIAAVVFFGYHYFTKPELKSCVSAPLDDLSRWQKENNLTFNDKEVKDILSGIASNVSQVASSSSKWAGKLLKRAEETTASGNLQNQVITKAQYLYCQSVVDKYQSR